ncbi:hypothetical protein BpHYR1_042516 [Brachionus plicatilis]|uniref:Uncharacterized protein n=1 Tax=Brachionus plicatilis TaxID=10195 RepID=A0A3M7PHK2_BRAPC|nr:hypothetical protein BpHYR1_042516 [Brachionus plicatilis]
MRFPLLFSSSSDSTSKLRITGKINNNMFLSILVDSGEALISFSCTFLSNGSDLTQRLNQRIIFIRSFIVFLTNAFFYIVEACLRR